MMHAGAWQTLPLPGAELAIIEDWLAPSEADALLAACSKRFPGRTTAFVCSAARWLRRG
jgi:hypothetical protein